jgi:hypothetical protein
MLALSWLTLSGFFLETMLPEYREVFQNSRIISHRESLAPYPGWSTRALGT